MKFKNIIAFFLPFFIIFLLILAKNSEAAITVFDAITVKGKPVMLSALTKGRFFPSGGKLVEFGLDGKSLGTTLSGGDGFAFLETIPHRSGLHVITVRHRDEKAEGYLLVCNKGDKFFFIEVESSLMGSLFSDTLRPGAKPVIKSLMKKFRIVYVTRLLGIHGTRKFLKSKNIPASVIIDSLSESFIEEIQEMGLIPYAIVGSPEFLNKAPEIFKKRFSFLPTEDAIEVEDWNDLREKLYRKTAK